MKIAIYSVVVSLAAMAGRLPAQQQVPPADAFAQQERAAARLEARSVSTESADYSSIRAAMLRRDGSKGTHALIGAIVGAVVLPAAIIVATHDSDSGSPTGTFFLVFGAIGALLGAMVGLSIDKH